MPEHLESELGAVNSCLSSSSLFLLVLLIAILFCHELGPDYGGGLEWIHDSRAETKGDSDLYLPRHRWLNIFVSVYLSIYLS